jgi:hypothetical protein
MNREELKKAIAEKAMTAGHAANMRSAYADIVMQTVEPNHLSLDLFSAFLPVRQLNPGDRLGKTVKRGRYPVRTMTPGAKHLTDVTDFVEQFTYLFDRLIAGTNRSLWEIQSGEVGTVEQMRTDLRADIFDELVSKVFTLLSTVWNSTATPNNFADASSTGITATVLDAMIETILDRSGQVRSIVGSRRALLPVYAFAQYREFVLTGTGTDRGFGITPAFDEFTRTNKVSTYKGIPLVELPQVYRNRLPANATGTLRSVEQRMIPTNKVLVIGDQAGEAVLFGSTEYADYTDPTTQPANYVLHAWQGYGMLIEDVEQIGVILTNT